MSKFRSYSYLVLGVALTLLITGVSLWVLLPAEMQALSNEETHRRARAAAQKLSSYATYGFNVDDLDQIDYAVRMTRVDPDVKFATVLDLEGNIIASTSDSSEVASLLAAGPGSDVLVVSSPVVVDDWIRATAYVGMETSLFPGGNGASNYYILGFSLLLIVLGLGVAFGVWQLNALREAVIEWQKRHRNLRMHTGSLQSSVKEHRQTEHALKQSEEKYRSLFESTMEQAMRDLEELNRHLERRKVDLEHEVGVRKKAERSLRRYAERLTALNEIERGLLEGRGLDLAVAGALKRLRELVSAEHANLIDIDLRSGRTRLLGESSGEEDVVSAARWLQEASPSSASAAPRAASVKLLNEESANAGFEEHLMQSGYTAYGRAPLVVEEEIVGVLGIATREEGGFSEEDKVILSEIAALLAIGVRQERMDGERALYEAELIDAKDRAEEMARLKSAFLTNMSHEIRTPISGIMGFSQVLHDEVPGELREFTGLIRESANRLLNTINSVLELARLESGGEGRETSVLDLGEAVAETCSVLEPGAVRKGLGFEFTQDPRACLADLDLASIERIVTNLVDNAIKFTERGGVGVEVGARDSEVFLRVTDTGVGISEDFLPKLFDEFWQEQMEADREHEGSGLGLAITKKLVDRLNGRIDVSSTKGEGTTVTVRFPRHGGAVSQSLPEVVVISANTSTTELIGRGLSGVARATHADNTDDAQAIVKNGTPLAVIVDINAAAALGAPGLAALRSGRPELRVIAFASQVLPENIQDVLESGYDRFVPSPFEGDSLAAAIRGEEPAATQRVRQNRLRPPVMSARPRLSGHSLGTGRVSEQ